MLPKEPPNDRHKKNTRSDETKTILKTRGRAIKIETWHDLKNLIENSERPGRKTERSTFVLSSVPALTKRVTANNRYVPLRMKLEMAVSQVPYMMKTSD